MLVERRAIVIAGLQQHGIDGNVLVLPPARFAMLDHEFRGGLRPHDVFRPEARGSGNAAGDLAGRTDRDDFLLIFGRLGKHAQFQHGPPRTRKIQHHIGVVEDVRRGRMAWALLWTEGEWSVIRSRRPAHVGRDDYIRLKSDAT